MGVSDLARPNSRGATVMALIMPIHHWMWQPHLCHRVGHLVMLLAHMNLGYSFQGSY